MKTILLTLSFIFFIQEDFPQVFTLYEDNIKAILIFAPDNQSKSYNQMISMLTRDPLGIDKRNIKIFEIFQAGGIGPDGKSISGEDVTSIRKYYNTEPSNFNIVLSIRKFEEIFRSNKILTVNEIFEKFDQLD